MLDDVTPAFAPTNGIVMLSSDEQPLNAELSMLVTLAGISMLVNELQPENAELPMLVSWLFSANVMLVNALFWNAYCPMLVTLAGISMLVKELQP